MAIPTTDNPMPMAWPETLRSNGLSRADVATWAVPITEAVVAPTVVEEAMAHQDVEEVDMGLQEEVVTDLVEDEAAMVPRQGDLMVQEVQEVLCAAAAARLQCMPVPVLGLPPWVLGLLVARMPGDHQTIATHRSTAPTQAPTPHQQLSTTTNRTTPTPTWPVPSPRLHWLVAPDRSKRWMPHRLRTVVDMASMVSSATAMLMLQAWLDSSKVRHPVVMTRS